MTDKYIRELEQRSREALAAAEALHKQALEAAAEANRLKEEIEAKVKAKEDFRTSGHIRFHIDRRVNGFTIRAYAPGVPDANRKLVYIGLLKRPWFKNEDIWEQCVEKLNGYMETVFETGMAYALLDKQGKSSEHTPAPDTSSNTNTPKKSHTTSIQPPVGPALPRGTRNDSIGRLFGQIPLKHQAVITAFYMPSGVTAESLMEKYKDIPYRIATMALRNKLRGYFNNHPDKEFTVEKANEILQIYKADAVDEAFEVYERKVRARYDE